MSTESAPADQTAALDQAQAAAAAAQADAGAARAELRLLKDELAAARLAQAEWDDLIGHIERERAAAAAVAAELDAIKTSTSWKTLWAVLGPYRWVRGQGGR